MMSRFLSMKLAQSPPKHGNTFFEGVLRLTNVYTNNGQAIRAPRLDSTCFRTYSDAQQFGCKASDKHHNSSCPTITAGHSSIAWCDLSMTMKSGFNSVPLSR